MRGVVAIIGRPNVGKSTLFNRLVETRQAIVDDQPGVTRDRLYGTCTWNGLEFSVVDTGGYVAESDDLFEAAIREQVQIALEEADVVLFMVDVTTGIMPAEAEVADIIRRHRKKNVLLVANKVDNFKREAYMADFYSLGLENMFPVSSLSGSGTGELLDAVVALLPQDSTAALDPSIPKVAIVGKPNVGKSSLVNAFLGKNAHIVTPIAGTTRDSAFSHFKAYNFDCYLVDTAGLRRKAKVTDNLEFYSTIRTVRAIEECDIALMLIDAQSGIQAQDLSIIHMISQHKKGLVILVNKWDLIPKTEKDIDRTFAELINKRIAPLSYVPILFVSALDKTRIHKAMETAVNVFQQRKRHIPTHLLNETILPYIQRTPPQSQRGRIIRIKHLQQVQGKQPTFVFWCNHPTLIQESYRRFLINVLRKEYGFWGWGLSIYFREK
jgi:GTPase